MSRGLSNSELALRMRYWELRDRSPNGRTVLPPELRAVGWRARGLLAWHRRSSRLIRQGLTSRGTARKYRRLGKEKGGDRIARLKREARERMARLRAARRPKSAWELFREGGVL